LQPGTGGRTCAWQRPVGGEANRGGNQLDITLAQQNLKQADFSICNLLGQTVYTQQETNLSPTYTKMLDLSNLPNGVYLVEVVVDGEVSVREVVKQ